MKKFIKRLHYILDQKSITFFNEKKEATLKETDLLNSYEILLKGLPENCIIVNTDKFKEQTSFFKSTNGKSIDGICKRADFAIINDDKIIFIELKSGKFKNNEIKQQFQGAQCVIDYCAAIGHRFFNDSNFLKPAIESCFFVLLIKTNSTKRPTRPTSIHSKKPTQPTSKEDYGKSPDNPNRIECPESVYYRALTQ